MICINHSGHIAIGFQIISLPVSLISCFIHQKSRDINKILRIFYQIFRIEKRMDRDSVIIFIIGTLNDNSIRMTKLEIILFKVRNHHIFRIIFRLITGFLRFSPSISIFIIIWCRDHINFGIFLPHCLFPSFLHAPMPKRCLIRNKYDFLFFF